MASLNVSTRSAPDPADVPTFQGLPVFTKIAGPVTLYRFGSRDGRWWYGKSLIDEMKSDFYDLNLNGERVRDPAGSILAGAREGLAVTHEWNKFTHLCKMTLPAANSIDAWSGPTAPQLEWRSKPDGRILHGGLMQFVIYDVNKIPRNLITEQSVMSLWMEFSRTVGTFKVK